MTSDWKQRAILISVLHKFVTSLLVHLPTYAQPRDLHRANDTITRNRMAACAKPYAVNTREKGKEGGRVR